ncbi:MAG TPA: TerC family protein [Candidatus Binatia bacterium]|jgi:YjbE family integral membrane protein
MEFIANPEFWVRWFGIVILDLSLAGDNALVIAMAVRTLPSREQFLGRVGGTLGAVALRFAFIVIITQLLRIPYLQAAGGLVLIWIAVKLLRQDAGGEGREVRHGTTLWEAIWVIIVADLIMSLDNVLAVAAAAHGDLTLVIFGIGLSIPIVICGAGFLAKLMNRFQWIVWIGGGILGWVAGEMVVEDKNLDAWIEPFAGFLPWTLPAVFAAALVSLGWWLARRSEPGEPMNV